MAPKKAYYEQLNHKNNKLLKKHEKEIVAAYEQAFMDAYEELIIATMDDDKYNEKKYFKAKLAYTRQLYEKLKELHEKHITDLNENYKACVKDFLELEGEFKNDKRYQEFKKLINEKVDITNEKVINIIKAGKIYQPNEDGNFVDLDNRLWNAVSASGKKLQDAILSCFAQGMGPADMARTISEFAKEGHKIWSPKKIREKLGPGYARSHSGGLDYPALRLARTTHTHVNQLKVIHSKDDNPYVDKIKYHSVHAAGRTCEMCEKRDGQIFEANKVPLDHPNGMCWLEPVFSMSEDEMADDLAKWVRGEPNSGIMDKAYPDVPMVKPEKKEEPKKEEKPKYEEVKHDDVEQYKEHFKDLVDNQDYSFSKRKKAKEYVDEAGDVLNKYFPDIIKQAYYKITPLIEQWTQNNEGAYWITRLKQVQFNITTHMNGKVGKYGIGKFDTWFHENGHAMDALLGEMYCKAIGADRTKVLSAQKPYINALKRDFENQKIMLRRKYLKEKGYENVDNMSNDELRQRIPDKNLNALYNHYLSGKHKTSGIQDVIEGMSNCEIHVQWGHGKQYWNRSDRELEYASEAWANMLGSYSDPETYEYMKEFFPDAMRMQENIIKTAMRNINKNK